MENVLPGSAGRLAVQIGSMGLANPVMPASGCFGPQLARLIPVHELGAVVTKTVVSAPRSGNPAHRIAEAAGVMLNSVGIPSPGVDRFKLEVLPSYRSLGPPVVVSVGGLRAAEFRRMAQELAEEEFAAYEVNVSCPNLERDGQAVGARPSSVERITADVKRVAAGRPVIVKLSPNVASIGVQARAAEGAGADAVTVANTFLGLSIDLAGGRPLLGNTVGGVSGPAMKPLVLRLVWETASTVTIPVIACGGVRTVDDVLEYLAVGATAVQVGTAAFTRPVTLTELVAQLSARLDHIGRGAVGELIGSVRRQVEREASCI